MYVWILISIFGVWFVHRTTSEIENLKIFSNQYLEKFRFISFSTIVLGNFVFKRHLILVIFINFLVLSLPVLFPFIIVRFRSLRAKKAVLPTLDSLILSMRSGRSFQMSLSEAIGSCDFYLKKVLEEFSSAISFQKQQKIWSSDADLNNFLTELWNVNQSPTKQIDLLIAFRRKLSLINNFRQKSRQALLQTRAQSAVTTGIYLLTLLFVQFEYGLRNHLFLTFVSICLFLVGLLIMQRMGRNYQWKI